MTDPDILYCTDGTVCEVTPKNGTNYGLKELYDLLGCEIVEVVGCPNEEDMILICDEEGTFAPDPQVNHLASYHACTPIVGNALRCHTNRFK